MTYNSTVIHVLMTYNNAIIHVLMTSIIYSFMFL
jgi:hypothetical protein